MSETDNAAGEREWSRARLVAHPEPGKVWVQIPHRNDIGSDWIEADVLVATPDPDDASTGASEPLSEDVEALAKVLHEAGRAYDWPSDQARHILTSDWLAAREAAARAEGAAEASPNGRRKAWLRDRAARIEESR